MKMKDVQFGMRLRSTIGGQHGSREEFATVTALTKRGFQYKVDGKYAMIPRLGMAVGADVHEHYGVAGEALFDHVGNICSPCSGRGCAACDGKGWVVV